ncbi:MAG: metallophosphoesterase [Candidatus Parvarchaeota archaeon]|nr:metallophosphoesterase [Candidatus Rehaiarchaeum fermentans]MCW1292891.1 metallophosphoesterase [Candidatus Rehaiarchaeum fermentans]MCW1293539.1 metallophosphoesterase [Candidatus Rehaiarchaeum fermentans]
MKILAASDLHANKSLVKKLVQKAKNENVDLVIIAGDLTIFGDGLSRLLYPFKEAGLKVAIIPGNHDTFEMIDFVCSKYNFYNLHKYPLIIGDIGIVGVGFSNIGPNYLSEEEIYTQLEKQIYIAKKHGSRRLILVSHTPPYNTKLDDIGFHVGSTSVRASIKKHKPEICICGHIHETFGLEDVLYNSRIINVGQEGKIINI